MLGDILLKLVSVLTDDDVRQLKAAGCETAVEDLLATWITMAIEWQQIEYGHIDSKLWADVQIKLSELRAALRG